MIQSPYEMQLALGDMAFNVVALSALKLHLYGQLHHYKTGIAWLICFLLTLTAEGTRTLMCAT
ncbi:hypothetical protein F971_01518 [Acinetobacter vivianii]|uniref:Uncharacterized protein n=1 Tax=Acinetobacter vivianii TaxID=1776742 RepID=N8UYT9_9GAMM|nr:hypothetical protein F971_01518 [Acinetobacter vivianii]